MQPVDFTSNTDNVGLPGLVIPLHVTVVATTVGFWHKNRNVLSDHFIAGITEEVFHDRVSGTDDALFVDGNDTIHHMLDHGAGLFFLDRHGYIGLLQIGGALRYLIFQFHGYTP